MRAPRGVGDARAARSRCQLIVQPIRVSTRAKCSAARSCNRTSDPALPRLPLPRRCRRLCSLRALVLPPWARCCCAATMRGRRRRIAALGDRASPAPSSLGHSPGDRPGCWRTGLHRPPRRACPAGLPRGFAPPHPRAAGRSRAGWLPRQASTVGRYRLPQRPHRPIGGNRRGAGRRYPRRNWVTSYSAAGAAQWSLTRGTLVGYLTLIRLRRVLPTHADRDNMYLHWCDVTGARCAEGRAIQRSPRSGGV
jgi:hypothetical protein